MNNLSPLERTFLELVAIDEVYPHEHEVLSYIKKRLHRANVAYKQDAAGNIIGHINGQDPKAEPLALVGHTDIAAPIHDRQVVIEADVIKTDGTGLLGADDKSAVAVMLELADAAVSTIPPRTIELIFTIGEEAGTVGAIALDMSLVKARQACVLDSYGRINNIVAKSPAYYKLNVTYIGHDAHPAEWKNGINAGAAIITAVSSLQQGEYVPGVTFNVGVLSFGDARNKVPGRASLQAELRSFDMVQIKAAAHQIEQHFRTVATATGVEIELTLDTNAPAYHLDETSSLYKQLKTQLATFDIEPSIKPTYGCFDGNILAARGLEVVMLGGGYYLPHGPKEYLNRQEFAELHTIITYICLGTKP